MNSRTLHLLLDAFIGLADRMVDSSTAAVELDLNRTSQKIGAKLQKCMAMMLACFSFVTLLGYLLLLLRIDCERNTPTLPASFSKGKVFLEM